MNRLLSSALITIAIVTLAACSAGSSGRTVEPVEQAARASAMVIRANGSI